MPERTNPAREAGLTLVEILVVVVIMGVLMAPLTTAVIEVLTVTPDAGARTTAAIERSRLADRFADDIANAKSVTFHDVICGTDDDSAALFTMNTGLAAPTYEVTFATTGAVMQATISRDDGSGGPPDQLAHGYCNAGDTVVTGKNIPPDSSCGFSSRTQYVMSITLADRPGDVATGTTHRSALRGSPRAVTGGDIHSDGSSCTDYQ